MHRRSCHEYPLRKIETHLFLSNLALICVFYKVADSKVSVRQSGIDQIRSESMPQLSHCEGSCWGGERQMDKPEQHTVAKFNEAADPYHSHNTVSFSSIVSARDHRLSNSKIFAPASGILSFSKTFAFSSKKNGSLSNGTLPV